MYVVAGGYSGRHPFLRSTEVLSATATAWEPGQDLPRYLEVRSSSISLDNAVLIIGKFHNILYNLNVKFTFTLFLGES